MASTTTPTTRPLHASSTALCCDAVERGPGAFFAVGNYQLDADTQEKRGCVLLYTFNATDGSFEDVSSVGEAAVFDVRWCGHALAQAGADGQVVLYALDEGEKRLVETAKAKVASSALFVEWGEQDQKQGEGEGGQRLAVSQSDGSVSVLRVAEGALTVADTWHAHDLEVWTVVFGGGDGDGTLYTGADDAAWKRWDLRASTQHPTFADTKTHTAGVCTIQPDPHDRHRIATGSYDEHLRVWDTRQLKRPVAEWRAGDGVWRVKWHPTRPSLLLTGCMRAGFHVLSLSGDGLEAVGSYGGHGEDLAYGCDWMGGGEKEDEEMVVSCSFYDNLLHSWSWTPRTID